MEKRVSGWLKVAGETLPSKPRFPKKVKFVRWFSMALEEMLEIVDSADENTINACQDLLQQRVEGLVEPVQGKESDLNELMDGAVDVAVVNANLLHFAGLVDQFSNNCEEVISSNWSKFCMSEEEAIEACEAYENGTHPHAKGKKYNADYKQSGNLWIIIDTDNNGKILKSLNYTPPKIEI